MRHYTLQELQAMPTLRQGQDADLKQDTGQTRVWLHRTGIEDGEPYAHTVTVETLANGVWQTLQVYGAVPMSDTYALDMVADILFQASDWDADAINAVADVVRLTGRVVSDESI